MNRFFIDAETDGLYGSFLSVAALVTDENGNEIERFYAAVEADASSISSEWVKENVLPHLENANKHFSGEKELLDSAWNFWLKYRESSYCVAYVQYPVEARLFRRCVEENVEKRAFLSPFPIYDLSTLLLARGYRFDEDISKLSDLNLKEHDAMNDVLIMADIWNNLI